MQEGALKGLLGEPEKQAPALEGHYGGSRGPRCDLHLPSLPLGLDWWESCWSPKIWEPAAELLDTRRAVGVRGAGPPGGRGVQGGGGSTAPQGSSCGPRGSFSSFPSLTCFTSPPVFCAPRAQQAAGKLSLPPMNSQGVWGGFLPRAPSKHVYCAYLCDLLGPQLVSCLVCVCRKITIKKH